MQVAVTGAAGFLGSHLVKYLLKQGHQVTGIDNLVGGDMANLPGDERFIFRQADIVKTHLDVLTDLLQDHKIVYHTAALAYEGLSVFSPSLIAESIVVGTSRVAEACLNAKVRRIVNCSSMARYGNMDPPFSERQIPLPVDPYGISKLSAELILNSLARLHDIEVIHAVPHNIYGPNQRYFDPYRNVAGIMVNRILQGRPPIIYGEGDSLRCFSYIDDVVPILTELGTVFDSRYKLGAVYNIGPDTEPITINRLANLLLELMPEGQGAGMRPIYLPKRLGEVPHATCSSAKIRKAFGFEPKTSLEDGMLKLIEYIRERGRKPFIYNHLINIKSDKVPKTWKEGHSV